jgi:hypothetical protein
MPETKKMTSKEKLEADRKAAKDWLSAYNKENADRRAEIKSDIKRYGRHYGD